MQARFPGTCRDCGNKFPAGTDIDWQRGQGASCCNGSPQVAKVAKATSSPMVVDGAQRMEWVDGKTTQEVVGFEGDSLVYEQKEYSGYSWMCLGCRLVWERQHQAINCEKREHVASFEQSYGGTVWDGRGFTPHGLVAGKYLPGTGTTYVRTAIRREKSPDVPPVAPAPVMEPHGRFPVEDYSGPISVEYLSSGGTTDGKYSEWEPNNYPQVEEPAPQADMTSDEMWASMGTTKEEALEDWDAALKENFGKDVLEQVREIRANESPVPGTITTTWN
jgi:hypothetical protein